MFHSSVRQVAWWCFFPPGSLEYGGGETVVLYLVEKLDEDDEYEFIRALEPEEEAALRTVKSGGEADEDMRAHYLRAAGSAHDNGCWFMCCCRFEGGRRPAIVPRVDTPERIFLVNRPSLPLTRIRGAGPPSAIVLGCGC